MLGALHRKANPKLVAVFHVKLPAVFHGLQASGMEAGMIIHTIYDEFLKIIAFKALKTVRYVTKII